MTPFLNVDECSFEDSIVINFDGKDERNKHTHVGGYMRVRQDYDLQGYNIVIFNADGDVISETNVPFDFKPAEE